MDQIKTGKFIAKMRREKHLTQRQLADKLSISDKTVSKWECGNGMPEISLMLPLCEILDISVNELLSGERLDEKVYQMKAEENMMNLIKEKEESRKNIILSVIVVLSTLIPGTALIQAAGLLEMQIYIRILFIAIGAAVIAAGIGVACVLDRDAGVYECTKCGAKFTPDMKSYIKGVHTVTRRKLKCPECGVKNYCRHRISR